MVKFHSIWKWNFLDIHARIWKTQIPLFWKTEIVFYVVARIVQIVKGFRRDVQNKKCSLACLVWSCKFLELLAKEKNENMLENFGLTRMHLEKYDRTCHAHISYAYRKRKSREQQMCFVY